MPAEVASQKIGPDASDMPRLAPPNTVTNRRDPFNFNGLRVTPFAAETVFPGKAVTICITVN